ncbi:hypothetical protein TSUD_380000 [Trifolium subterraneum]|uniref:Uncharacterized protein n=1 Tax=Trifolium subterraneum TaxID=3900 RepID=A0A2Z6LZT1_TRISU|nr:hypothetical protein TSUD_380000 [Trifolium subterraneum]
MIQLVRQRIIYPLMACSERGDGLGAGEGGGRDIGSAVGCGGCSDGISGHISFGGEDRGGGIGFWILIGYKTTRVNVSDDIGGDVGGEGGGGEGRGWGGNWDIGGSGGGDMGGGVEIGS